MSEIAIKIENLSKQYRLGQVGTGTISHDLNRWWHKVRGKENPYLKIGEANVKSEVGGSEYVWALKDVNLEVKQGEILGVIGKNGAGKSTLLKLLSKVTSPTTGQIKAKGRIASLLEVGTGFHPEMTGRENIFMNGTIMGMTRHEISRKLDEIVEFAGVARYVDTPVKRYSSGMTVRLGFSIAAHLEPEILVVDEVLAVGDAEFQKKAIGKMQSVSQGEGRTVLFVSHNMASVAKLCSTAIQLENGMKTFEGNTSDAIERYLSTNSYNADSQDGYSLNSDAFRDVKILGIKARGQNGNKILREEAIFIEFEIEYFGNGSVLGCTLHLSDKNGRLIFDINNFIDDSPLELHKGVNKFSLSIPANVLKPDYYTISHLLLFDDGKYNEIYSKKDVLVFNVESEAIFTDINTTTGVIYPRVKWQKEKD